MSKRTRVIAAIVTGAVLMLDIGLSIYLMVKYGGKPFTEIPLWVWLI